MTTRLKKVLIIGGFGLVGQTLLPILQKFYQGPIDITLASRSPDEDRALWLGCKALKIDITEPGSIDKIKTYDLVILTAGPFSKLAATSYKNIIEAEVPCIDINDSLSAYEELISLKDLAEKKQTPIFTGMGLMPGLSTYLLLSLLNRAPQRQALECKLDLYMGAKNSSGSTGSSVLVENFSTYTGVIREGSFHRQKAQWSGANAKALFPSHYKKCTTLPFSSPECLSLSQSSYAPHLKALETRYHVQFLPAWFARLAALLKKATNGTSDQIFIKLMNASSKNIATKKGSSAYTSLKASLNNVGLEHIIHGEYPTHRLTAVFAALIASYFLKGLLGQSGGIWSYESIHEQCPQISDDLEKAGIITVCEAQEQEDIFAYIMGHSSPSIGSTAGLRHYQSCWYDHPLAPIVKHRQMACLKQSELWRNAVAQVGYSGLSIYLVRFLLRWRKHHKILKRNALDHSYDFGPMIKDISMFSSGYSCYKDRFGEKIALARYKEMFLNTAAYEMAWLWPNKYVFRALPHPSQAVASYFEAYLQAYRKVGIYDFQVMPQNASGIKINYSKCLFSEWLTELGTPELKSLIREMELDALARLAATCDLRLLWKPIEADSSLGTLELLHTQIEGPIDDDSKPIIKRAGYDGHVSLAHRVITPQDGRNL